MTAYNTVTIKSRVDGQLIRECSEGQSVRKGELLVEIDPTPYQAALAQAQGQLVKDEATAVNAQAEAARYDGASAGRSGFEGDPAGPGIDRGTGSGND